MINKNWIEKTKDYKTFVGNPKDYDKIGNIVFNLLLKYGLKPEHKLLDIGCGSLRVGKHIIKYLDKYNYCGLEPNNWLFKEESEKDSIKIKIPAFNDNRDFELDMFHIHGFDYILCNSVFIHACKQEIEKVFSQLKEVLKPDGKFIFNFIQGDKDNNANEWTYPSHICYTWKYFDDLRKQYNLTYELPAVNYPGKQKFIIATFKE